jgi:hypothetical protein
LNRKAGDLEFVAGETARNLSLDWRLVREEPYTFMVPFYLADGV